MTYYYAKLVPVERPDERDGISYGGALAIFDSIRLDDGTWVVYVADHTAWVRGRDDG